MSLNDALFLIFTPLVAWWLSGYDKGITGESRFKDFMRRFLRCAFTLLLVELATHDMTRWFAPSALSGGWICVVLVIVLALLWRGCISELCSCWIHGLIDPKDGRSFDPNEASRNMDALASLVQSGQTDAAIRLCRKLKKSGAVSDLAMEAMLARLGVQADSVERGRGAEPKQLANARRFHAQGKFTEAVAEIEKLLKKDPTHLTAALMLMRIHVQDLQQPQAAEAVLQRIKKQPQVPDDFVEYASRSIAEWTRPVSSASESRGLETRVEDLLGGASPLTPGRIAFKPANVEETPGLTIRPPVLGSGQLSGTVAQPDPTSADELLAAGYLGTAVEILEAEVKARPDNFDSWMKLAEAYGRYCRQSKRARQIIEQLQDNPAFSAEQIQFAWARFREWCE